MPGSSSRLVGLKNRIEDYFDSGPLRWIKRCYDVELGSGYRGMFNSLYLTRLYYKKGLLPIIQFFSRPRRFKEVDALLRAKSTRFQEDMYNLMLAALERRFIIPDAFSESQQIAALKKRAMERGVQIKVAYLILSLNCNLRCPHCFLFRDRLKSDYPVMTKEEIERCIDYFAFNGKEACQDLKLTFYGGEPLLYPELIKHAVLYAEKVAVREALDCQFLPHIKTNATVMNDDFLSFAQEHRISFAVSLDGFPAQHDKMRFDEKGAGTFKRVMGNAEKMLKRNLQFGIAIAVTRQNVATLPRFVDWLQKKFGKGFSLNCMIDNTTLFTKVDKKYLTDLEYLLYYTAYKGIGNRGLLDRRDVFKNNQPHGKFCGALASQITFLPGGLMGPCNGLIDMCYKGSSSQFVKMPRGKKLKNHPLWKRWNRLNAYYTSKCFNECDFFTLCGGLCPQQSLVGGKGLCCRVENLCRVMEMECKINLTTELGDLRKSSNNNEAVY